MVYLHLFVSYLLNQYTFVFRKSALKNFFGIINEESNNALTK